MIIDFRYHIASLVAIFIALGLGILIGSTLVGQDFMENVANEQRALIERLEEDYLSLRQETKNLKLELNEKNSQLAFYQNFMLENRIHFIRDKLQGRNFAIVQIGQNEYTPEVIKILEEAGAGIITANFFSQEAIRIENVNLFVEEIGKFILKGEQGELVGFLTENQFMETMGTHDQPLDGIIFLDSVEEREQELFSELQISIIKFLEKNLPVYIVHTGKSKNSLLAELNNFPDVFSIENFDNIYGQIALVLQLMDSGQFTDKEVTN